MISLFGKKKDEKKPASAEKAVESAPVTEKTEAVRELNLHDNTGAAYRILKGVYVSEKASMLLGMNQYVFKVTDTANKTEIAKNVGKLFNVKVKKVRIVNIPDKNKQIGRHEGIKAGFKKAIVTLEEGETIAQLKA